MVYALHCWTVDCISCECKQYWLFVEWIRLSDMMQSHLWSMLQFTPAANHYSLLTSEENREKQLCKRCKWIISVYFSFIDLQIGHTHTHTHLEVIYPFLPINYKMHIRFHFNVSNVYTLHFCCLFSKWMSNVSWILSIISLAHMLRPLLRNVCEFNFLRK